MLCWNGGGSFHDCGDWIVYDVKNETGLKDTWRQFYNRTLLKKQKTATQIHEFNFTSFHKYLSLIMLSH